MQRDSSARATSPMRRVFTGLKVPASIAGLLTAFQERLPGVRGSGLRWYDPDDLHVTLRFIGGVPAEQIPFLIETLRTVRGRRLQSAIVGAEVFREAGALVAEIGNSAELTALHAAISVALATQGIPPEPRAYRPHITLGRWPRRIRVSQSEADTLNQRLAHYIQSLPEKAFPVDEFTLYETVSGHYWTLGSFGLHAPGSEA